MNLWESLLVSAVPVICETIILQAMYIALYKVSAAARLRLTYGLLFITIQYPVVYLTDNIAFLAPFSIIRSILIFLLYALMLRAVFRGRFLSRCLPAAAIFAFVSIVIETLLWFGAKQLGLDITNVRYTLWKVLLFQAILYAAEFSVVLLIKKHPILSGYSEQTTGKMWLPTVGYLIVVSAFWIGLIQQIGGRFREGAVSPWDIAGIVVCLVVSLMFVKSSMDLSREIERRQWELDAQKLELEYQKLYNSGMEAVLSELSRFRHNYSNMLAALRGHAESGNFKQLKEYIDELCQKQNMALLMNRETLSEIKIGAVAGLFAAKMFMAEKAEVTFNLSVNGQLASVHMQVMELCEILGILLDNAVEAAAISSGKYVRADIEAIDDDGAVFRIENSVDRKPSISRMSEKGYTTKEEGSGIGLYIAETILQKYPASSLNTFADGERVVQEFCVK